MAQFEQLDLLRKNTQNLAERDKLRLEKFLEQHSTIAELYTKQRQLRSLVKLNTL